MLAGITLVSLFLNPDYVRGVWGACVWFAFGMAYFVFWARKRLILAPEEEFAVSQEAGGRVWRRIELLAHARQHRLPVRRPEDAARESHAGAIGR